jgi:hypothetical protein
MNLAHFERFAAIKARVRSAIDALDLPKGRRAHVARRAALAILCVAIDSLQDAGLTPTEIVQTVNSLLEDDFDRERAAKRLKR